MATKTKQAGTRATPAQAPTPKGARTTHAKPIASLLRASGKAHTHPARLIPAAIIAAAILAGCGGDVSSGGGLAAFYETPQAAPTATPTPPPTSTPAPTMAAAVVLHGDPTPAPTAAAPVAVPPTSTPAPVVEVVIEIHSDFTPCQPAPGADVCEVTP